MFYCCKSRHFPLHILNLIARFMMNSSTLFEKKIGKNLLSTIVKFCLALFNDLFKRSAAIRLRSVTTKYMFLFSKT